MFRSRHWHAYLRRVSRPKNLLHETFLPVTILPVSLTGRSQSLDPSKVHRLRCFAVLGYNHYAARDISDHDWRKVDILIAMDLNKDKIHTYGKRQMDYDIYYEALSKRDGAGNLYLCVYGKPAEGWVATLTVYYLKDNYSI